MWCYLFFQAEDGIRDLTVTGVQTCALPILSRPAITATVDLAVSPHTPSVTPPVAASAPKGNERSGREKAVWYTVIALAIVISAGAIWGWLRPAPAKQVVRSMLAIDSS